MPKNIGFYVTLKATGERFFLEKSWKWDRWYYTADGWTTQATGKLKALREAGKIPCACTQRSTCGEGDRA